MFPEDSSMPSRIDPSWAEDFKEYRDYYKFEDAHLPYLDEKALEKEKQGDMPEKDPVTYPF